MNQLKMSIGDDWKKYRLLKPTGSYY